MDVKEIKIGDVVHVVDEHYKSHVGLVTALHGTFGQSYVPSINAVFVSSDAQKTDPYGRQTERLSSLQHVSAAKGMTKPGRYWE